MTEQERSKKLDKVRALLAKAESTDFAEEAKSYFELAQKLMTSYAIEDAELRDLSDSDETPTVGEIIIMAPYVRSKGSLLASVAVANNCQVVAPYKVKGKRAPVYRVFGYANRVAAVEELYTSLLVQMAHELRQSDDLKPYNVHGKTWANNFLIGYAHEIHARLKKAQKEAEDACEVGNALVLLRNEKDDVERHVAKVYPRLGTARMSGYADSRAQAAGRAAGGRASLGGRTIGATGAIGR